MDLIDALRKLDSEVNAHWVKDQPSLTHLSAKVGGPVTSDMLDALGLDLGRPAPGATLVLPEPEKSAAEVVDVLPNPHLEKPEEAMLELQAEKEKLQKEIDKATVEVNKLTAHHDSLTAKMDKLISDAEASAIPGHVRTQIELKRLRTRGREEAIERAKRRTKALKLVEVKDLDPRSKLDASMARSKGRGMQRPKPRNLK